jgi:putative sterol carrier protein
VAQAQSAREFFETLESKVDPAKAAALNAVYRFDIDGAGSWIVRVANGSVHVDEGGGDADTTISTSEQNFLRLVRREQNPMTAFMTGKLRVSGDMQAAMKLQKLF